VEQIVRESIYPQTARPIPRLRLSPLVLIVVIIWVGLAVVTIVAIGVRAVVQYSPTPLNPFPAYADVFPGQPASALETRGFSCQYFYDFYHRPAEAQAPTEASCIFTPAAGAFLNVKAIISDGTIYTLTFIIRDNTLRVGDLAQLLGTPAIHRFRYTAFFQLPTSLVRVEPVGQTKQFSLFLPVASVTFMKLM
jgi:hypothetical protein